MIKIGLSLVLLLGIVLTSALMLSCNQDQSPTTEGVIATVNGKPITDMDLLLNSRKAGGHQAAGTDADTKKVLEDIILQELASQRAINLGLDADPAYQEELRRMEAQVNAIKRKRLSEVFFQRELIQKTRVSDAEARQYFAEYTVRLRTEIKVWQILRRNENQIEQAKNDLAQGMPFEDVAAKQFPNLPPTVKKPWEMGYLRWNQVPKAWQNVVYDLQVGQTSDIIRGPNNRFWIIKLIDTRENTEVTFEQIKPMIIDVLKNEKARQLREEIIRELRDKARIVYVEQDA